MSSDWVDAKIIAVSDCDSSHVAIDIEVKNQYASPIRIFHMIFII